MISFFKFRSGLLLCCWNQELYLSCPSTILAQMKKPLNVLTHDQITCDFRKWTVEYNFFCLQVFISILDVKLQKKIFNSVYIEFPSGSKQPAFIHGEISIRTKLGFHFHQHQNSQSWLLLGSWKVGPRNKFPKM